MSNASGRRLAAQSFKWLLREPSPRDVLWLNYAVTYRCNSRCAMCSIWQLYRKQPQKMSEEIDRASIEAFLESSRLKHLIGISFTGGEPLLRSDFVDIFGSFVARHPRAIYAIATNGLNTDRTVATIHEVERRFDPEHLSVSLSLDGLSHTHDEVRGVEGAYESVTTTIGRLQRETAANIGVSFTITPWNYNELLKVYRYAKERNIAFLACFAQNSDAYYRNAQQQFSWDAAAIDTIETDLKRLVRERSQNESLWERITDPYDYFFAQSISHLKNPRRHHRCYSGTHSLFLDPYGNVYPCIMGDRRMGNIKDGGFDVVWGSAEAKVIRRDIRAGRCSCWVACEAVPSMLRKPNFLKWNLQNKL
jgi:MoaA/NifB/PqqE/SkfB family radical SAM enzyme